ncbi:MAG: MerR family transcriptional regulator [Pseudomonadota bacterium]
MAEKSRDAFRTISEVADWLDVPTHVLRFWESRFSQIKPVKRAGGRRYYRPSDMRVIGGVKVLLHDQGMTIRGVQKLFREEGIKHVSGYAPELFGEGLDEGPSTPALNEEALERAARPAPAARSTHAAEPDPDETLLETEETSVEQENIEAGTPDDQLDAETPPLFRHAGTEPVEVSEPKQPTPEPAEQVASPEPELPEVAAPTIPATPDVPNMDPTDDAADHALPAGIAARLKLAKPEVLVAHKTLLAEAAERLRAVANRPD